MEKANKNCVFLPTFLGLIKDNSTVYDVGCGKNPAISLEIKNKNKLKIVGIDISKDELLKSPTGMLDNCIEADICNYNGNNDGNLVLCTLFSFLIFFFCLFVCFCLFKIFNLV